MPATLTAAAPRPPLQTETFAPALARPRVLFLGSAYAGNATRFANLRAHSEHDARIRPEYRSVTGWREGGRVEQLPGLPRGVRGRLRATLEAASFARVPRPDVIWTSAASVLAPHLWAQLGPLHRPLVLDLDWTLAQQEAFAPHYFGRAPRRGLRALPARLQEQALWSRVTLFTPWTEWTAGALKDTGVPAERIRVIRPGVDLGAWAPPAFRTPRREKLRLLFVGGDFARKGGELLLEVLRGPLAETCELDLVTREQVATQPGVRVHRAETNSPALKALFARADLFVLPSLADCSPIAVLEALASGLPVLVSNTGAMAELVEDGVSGWVIEPSAGTLAAALRRVVAQREALPGMGEAARALAERRFDGATNDRAVVDAILEVFAATGRVAPR